MPSPNEAPVADLVVQGPDIETPLLKALARLSGAETIVALPGTATQAFRLPHAPHRDAVAVLHVEGLEFLPIACEMQFAVGQHTINVHQQTPDVSTALLGRHGLILSRSNSSPPSIMTPCSL